MTAPDDLGFDKLLADDGLIAGLLGKTASGINHRLLYGSDLPVVLLVGGPGMGKGRLLRCVRARFGPYVPTAHIDCGSSVYRDRAGQSVETRSELTETLREIALQLRAWQGDGGPVATPRLYAGLAVIASSDGLASTADLVDEVRRHDELLPPASFWRGVLNRAVRGYLAALAGLVAGPMAVPITTAVVEELFTRASQDGRAALDGCYGEYPGAGGHPKQGLRTLASDFQLGGETRDDAEGFLFRALREDVEAAYSSLRGRFTRVGRPAVLLDHADDALGRRLLTPVLEDRESGHHDRLVVVATARREDGGRFLHSPGSGDDSDAGAPAWSPSEGRLPAWNRPAGDGVPGRAPLSRGTLEVRMPVLTREQQQRETARFRDRGQRNDNAVRLRVDGAVHRLSAGRPLVVTRLADACGALRLPEDFTAWALLDAPLPPRHDTSGESRPAPAVSDVLLEELIVAQPPEELLPEHHDHWLDLLTHLSVAHDVECAQALLRDRPESWNEGLSAYRIDELLRDGGWPWCPKHFIGDLGLRHLLMRRLYRLRDGGRSWQENHTLLRQRYESMAADSPDALFGTAAAHAMNHRLSCAPAGPAGPADPGEPTAPADPADPTAAGPVTEHLERAFLGRETDDWSEELLAIAQAPVVEGEDGLRARALGETPATGDALHRRMTRLLHTVRLCEDHTRTADEAVAGSLRRLLERLGEDSAPRAQVLTRLARDWSERAANRQPLGPCACTRHIG